MPDFIPCLPLDLPPESQIPAAENALQINPTNRPSTKSIINMMKLMFPDFGVTKDEVYLQPEHLAVVTGKRWPTTGAKLAVAFMDSAPLDLQARILQHANAWSKYCGISFVLSKIDPTIRIARLPGQGYYSYLGTDNLQIPKNTHTMNLEGFTMATQDSEFYRVVRHEFGHACAFPHEHMRKQLVARLDPQKTIAWGARVLGWSEQMVRQQILTPLSDQSIRATTDADQESIMCYQLPAEITVDGLPIKGGIDIDAIDAKFAGEVYPLEGSPPSPPVGGGKGTLKITMATDQRSAKIEIV